MAPGEPEPDFSIALPLLRHQALLTLPESLDSRDLSRLSEGLLALV